MSHTRMCLQQGLFANFIWKHIIGGVGFSNEKQNWSWKF